MRSSPTADLPVETVNFHVWQPCNMRCAFCFAKFRDVRAAVLPHGHLAQNEALRVVALLAEAGFQKITFAGGEPFLCPWLLELIATAKQRGMTTAVVTNGSLLTDQLLAQLSGLLDWLAISIDSADPEALRTTGRLTADRVISADQYLALCQRVTDLGIRLKVNTVVTQANWREDLSGLLIAACPLRWKVMQVLPILGQNAATVNEFLVTAEQFWSFVDRHRQVEDYGVVLVAESNQDMIGSYAMVDPAGRFFDNTKGVYTYSDPILLLGVAAAIAQVTVSREKFLARGGRYAWSAPAMGRL